MNISNFRIKSALIGLILLVGNTAIPAVASNSVPSTKLQESKSKVVGNERILLAQSTDLTGKWFCNDPNSALYIRQVNSEIWAVWDGGFTFTNTFFGSVVNGVINGRWADVPKASFTNYGSVSGQVVSSNRIILNFTFDSAGGQVNTSTCTR
ncbi:hypothetical protein LC607_17420 [Nostoc sp. CHAB 5824]|nr:hypothetical protein [Nostoc sp. CHAB 5824]